MRERTVRRVAGLLRARLPELDLESVPDPRAREGRWSLAQILRATLVGLMAGCRSLWEAEQLTAGMAPVMRRRLGLPRRLADTTARDALCRVGLDDLRAALHRTVRAAWRRKALEPAALPMSVVALDGKATALPTLNHPLVQNHIDGQVVPFGLVRTVTCSLVSAPGRPCIDAIPIPGSSNEGGHCRRRSKASSRRTAGCSISSRTTPTDSRAPCRCGDLGRQGLAVCPQGRAPGDVPARRRTTRGGRRHRPHQRRRDPTTGTAGQ